MGSIKRISISEPDMKSLLSESDDPPYPRDFELFIPWVFQQFAVGKVTIKRFSKDEYEPVAAVVAKKLKKPSEMSKKDSFSNIEEFMRELSHINLTDHVIISAYYDTNRDLVEIAFIDCPVPVPTEMFMFIQLCLPYNQQLTRITWKGARLTSTLVYELSRIIPGSEITDVIIDGCYVPQGNYYVLLDKASKLKYLSLTNCKINDGVCAMIAERIQRNGPAAENLLVLNLSSNRITDVGAEALGRSLRTNRRLLYLNLCNNDITGVGAARILLPLTKFKLSIAENRDQQLLKLKSVEEKLAANDKSFKKVASNAYFTQRQEIKSQKSTIKKKVKGLSHFEGIDNETQVSDASITSITDVYQATVTEEKKGSWYSSGNFMLCSLNLAYNRLDLAAVARIVDVVSYQYGKRKRCKTGLLRVVIEGNPLPRTCTMYDLINKYINLAISQSIPKSNKAVSTPHVNLTKSKTSRADQIAK